MSATLSMSDVLPTRVRPFEKTQKPTPPWLRLLLGRALAPTRAEFDRAGQALREGDPEADALVAWMFSQSPRQARAQFEQALQHGIDSVTDAPQPLRDFFAVVDREPDWLDRELLDDGIRFIHRTGAVAPVVLRDLALMAGYLLSGFNHALVMTGALNQGTSRRIAETGKWWMDCTEFGGLERFGDGFKSTLHVRLVHALVRRSLAGREDWDHARWGTPLNQIDMVATYLGFCVVLLGGVRKMGIPVTPRESRGVMHLWRYACWIMGVQEQWLVDSERDGIILLSHALTTQSPPDHTSRELGRALSLEPLERQYPFLQDLRRKLAYHQHLSVTRYFIGARKMPLLGLPDDILPWYPLLTLGPRLLGYSAQRLLPAARRRQEARGRRMQRELLGAVFGDRAHQVIQPGADHPAHI